MHISLLETTEEPAFLGTTDARPPHCPACRSVFSDWKSQLQAWQRDKHHETWRCAKCGKKVEVQKLDWVRSGGIARYSLDLWGIREGVAIPSAELLNLLERLTHHRWSYFYYRLGTGTMGRGHATVQPL